MKPRLLLVARTRYALPLSPSLERKFAPLRERFDLRVLATAASGRAQDDGTFRLVRRLPVLDGLLFWLLLPFRLHRLARRHGAEAIVAQSPYEAALARLAGVRAPIVVELHGDWRTATRLYGSPLRRVFASFADAFGAWGIRRAAAVRTLSPYTSGLVRELGVEPAGEFVAFMDFAAFLDPPPVPLPEQPAALFVGVLERYKNVDGLAQAWRLAAPQLPEARLRLVGAGSRAGVVEGLVRDLPGQTVWDERLPQEEVARALDESTCLVLPSRSEGLGRVIVEAFCRGRPVIAARVGGIPDLVEDGVNGLLVDATQPDALANAVVRVLSDPALAERLAAGAAASSGRHVVSPEEYAANVEAIVRRVVGP